MNINLTDKDNETKISAHRDDLIIITLEWKPSSGYMWQESDTTAGILEEVKHNPPDNKPGAIAIISFKFKIINSGSLKLNYARPWAETDPPTKWFEVTIEI